MPRLLDRVPRLRSLGLDAALALLFVVAVAPFVQTLTAQGAARYAYSAAIVEHQTVELDRYAPIVGMDRVERDGHIYSDKAPAQPLLGAAVLGFAGWLGAEPATEFRIEGNLGVWSQSLVFCTIPGAILLVLLRRHAARWTDDSTALLAAGGLVGTTMLLPLSSHLYGHVMAAMLVFAAWHLVTGPSPSMPRVTAAGGLAALACTAEYPVAMAAGVIGIWVLARLGWRATIVYGLPLVAGLGLVVAHNRLLYATSSTGYSSKGSGRLNFLGVPDLGHVAQIMMGQRGFIFTPIVLVALAGLIVGLRQGRSGLWVPAVVFCGYLWLQAGWSNPWGGEGPGPRYLSTALPFLVVPAAIGLGLIRRRVLAVLLAIGAVSMGLALVTVDLVPHGSLLIQAHLERIADDGVSPTLFTMAIGPLGWLLHVGLLAGAAVLVHTRLQRPEPRPASAVGPSIGAVPATAGIPSS